MTATITPSARTSTPTLQLVCSEVWGGNRPIHAPVELPGLRGVLYSQPCGGGRGGDVHYLSVCGSGLLSRACLADVAGHGETVAQVSGVMHSHLRRSMNRIDQRRVLAELNARLDEMGLKAMTTAAAVSYYPPSRKLSVSYAGHPPGWIFRRNWERWVRLELDHADDGAGKLVNGPLAVDPDVRFTRKSIVTEIGDRLVLVTDGVLEAPAPHGDPFGSARMDELLQQHQGDSCEQIAESLLIALQSHCGRTSLSHDDVTFLVVEVVPGPPGPTLWTVVKNRLLRPKGTSEEEDFA